MYGQVPEGQGQPLPPHPQMGSTPPPMGAPAPPMGAPPPPPKRPSPIVWVAIGAAALLFVGVFGVMAFQQASNKLSGPVKAEQCVDTGFGMDKSNRIPAGVRVKCDDAKAKAKVLKVTDEGKATGFQFSSRAEPDCPSGTDGVTNVRGKPSDKNYYEACVRNLKGPHPGDPGAGGAFLSVGDCVSSGSIGLGGEKPCSGSDWYGKVIARVDTEKSCPAQTLETMKMRPFGGGKAAHPVLCLGAGGGVLASGDCIDDPSFDIGGLDKADCGGGEAVAKVVGRVASTQKCPAEATHYMTSEGAYLPVLCLQKLRPTLTEKLRSLPG